MLEAPLCISPDLSGCSSWLLTASLCISGLENSPSHQLSKRALLGAHVACRLQVPGRYARGRYVTTLGPSPFRCENAEKWFCPPCPRVAWRIKLQLSTFGLPFVSHFSVVASYTYQINYSMIYLLYLPNKLIAFRICFLKSTDKDRASWKVNRLPKESRKKDEALEGVIWTFLPSAPLHGWGAWSTKSWVSHPQKGGRK